MKQSVGVLMVMIAILGLFIMATIEMATIEVRDSLELMGEQKFDGQNHFVGKALSADAKYIEELLP